MSEWREFCSTHQVESLADLTPSIIRTYVLWMQEQRPGRKAQTFNMRIIAIKGFLRFCAEDGLLPDNLAHVIRRLPEEKRDVEPLSEEQVSALIGQPDCTSFTGLRDRLIMQLLYDTGVRVTELVNVGVPDIDFEKKLITIRHGKGRKQRVVPFGKDCQATLVRYLAQRGDLEHTVLLVTHDRRPYISDGLARQGANLVQTMVTRTAKRARIARKVHPHLFRHTFAVHYLRQNPGEIFKLQAILGHATLDMVRRYLYIAERDLQTGTSSPLDQLHTARIATAELPEPAEEPAELPAADAAPSYMKNSCSASRLILADPADHSLSERDQLLLRLNEVHEALRDLPAQRERAQALYIEGDATSDETKFNLANIERRRARLETERRTLEARLAECAMQRRPPSRPGVPVSVGSRAGRASHPHRAS